jgi:signal transduction histidine kinase
VPSARIRFAPDILRRLGEELNPSLDQGVVELVKNSYDADAHHCVVELIKADRSRGTLRVSDDGRGMSLEDLANGFLVLGRSSKTTRQRTPSGRIPAGNKGLGRLAALRLGRRVILRTRPVEHPKDELTLEINWRDFDDADVVDDVPVGVEVARRARGASSGSIIEVRDLQKAVRRMEVKRLARSMVLLADPFGDDPDSFQPTLRAPEFQDLERLVQDRYFDDAEYHLRAEVDEDGLAHAVVTDWRGGLLFEATHEMLAVERGGRPYRCPPGSFDFWVYLLSKTAFATRTVSVAEVREWLEAFGGVHLYLNGLRVAPYGNPGDDWLGLNLRRVQSPEERPGTNTSIGRVSVTDLREDLLQKTDRSGIVEEEAFTELRQFAQDAAEWMAKERLRVAERRRRAERKEQQTKADSARNSVVQEIERASESDKPALAKAFRRYERAKDRETDSLRREVQLYRTLSTAGITAATFAHEVAGSPVKVIGQAVRAIERRGRKSLGDDFSSTLAEPVDSIKRSLNSLSVLSAATLRLVDHEKRRTSRVDLHDLVDSVVETFQPFLDGRDVKVSTSYFAGDPYLRATPASLESVVTNLLNNSVVAFESAGSTEREIAFRTELVGDHVLLTVSDSGPGISGIDLRDIWSPGVTSQPNGTGLGLTIVRDAVADLSGSVGAAATSELGGAEFTIELPILGW